MFKTNLSILSFIVATLSLSYISVSYLSFFPIWVKQFDPRVKADPNSNIDVYPSTNYKAHVISSQPLLVYIENFVSESERNHLLSLASESYRRSEVLDGDHSAKTESRTSSTALLPSSDDVVASIRRRAFDFQNFNYGDILKGIMLSDDGQLSSIEPLYLVKYVENQKFTYHYDWYPELPETKFGDHGNEIKDRWTSFFVFLQADNVTGGETHFPRIARPQEGDGKWCKWLSCDYSSYKDSTETYLTENSGVKVKPLAGNAVFWINRHMDGTGDERSLHAGLAVEKGVKVGMNIWTEKVVPIGSAKI